MISKRTIEIIDGLDRRGYLNWMPDKMYLKFKFRVKIGKKLNLKNPQTFNEKLQWLKLYDRKPIYTTMVDKYEVKKYVADIIGEEYIILTYGVWNTFDEIDFDSLPNQFVLKCTHDSGGLVICKDKSNFDMEKAKEKINECLKTDYYMHNREWPYKDVKPRIIAEKYMQDTYSDENEDIKDYKFYCFNGKPKLGYISQGLSDHSTARISYVDLEWKRAPFHRSDYKEFEVLPEKPENYEQMLQYAEILSKNTSFLRVDFYEIDKKIYFGELTFSPGGGFTMLTPDKWDEKLGDLINLPR